MRLSDLSRPDHDYGAPEEIGRSEVDAEVKGRPRPRRPAANGPSASAVGCAQSHDGPAAARRRFQASQAAACSRQRSLSGPGLVEHLVQIGLLQVPPSTFQSQSKGALAPQAQRGRCPLLVHTIAR